MIPMHNEAFVKSFMRYWESFERIDGNLAKLGRRDD